MSDSVKKRILLVEDEALLAMNEKVQLEKYGYAVRTVTTGEKAVEAVHASPDIDLILMDINLGRGIDGTQAAEIILKDRDIPIVFLSSHTDPEVVEKTEKITSYGYVVKNSNITVLDASIKMAFRLFDAKNQLKQELCERERMEEALHASEEKFRALFEKGPIGVAYHEMVYDDSGIAVDYRFLDANTSYRELTGVDPRGKLVTEAFPGIENDPFDWIGTFGRVAKTGEQIRFEQYLQSNDRWYDCVGYQVKPDHFVAAFVEITQRKHAEKAMGEQRNFAERLIDTVRTIILVLDTNGNIVQFNPYTEELLGFSLDETKGMNWVDTFVQPEDSHAVQTVFQKTLADNQVHHNVNSVIGKDGQTFVVEWSNEVLTDTDGHPTGVLATGVDVTERMRMEGELNERICRHRELEAQIPVGVYIVWIRGNGDKEFEYVSDRWCEILGVSREAVLNDSRAVDDLVHPDDQARFVQHNRDAAERQEPFSWEGRFSHKNGEVRCLRIESTPRLHENGDIRWFGVTQDITERNHAEEELQMVSKMQSIILGMASDYINKAIECLDETINDSLKEIGEFVDADRAYVFEYDWVKDVANNTYEWCHEGVNPEIGNLQGVSNTDMHRWVEAHRDGKEINIPNVALLPLDDEARRVLEPQGVKSVLALPMMRQGECIGFVGFDSVRETKQYTETEKTLLKVFSEMLVNIGNRQELENNLIQAKDRAEEISADLTAIIEGTTDSIWSFDGNYDIRYINDRFRHDFCAAFGVWLDKGGNLVDALPEAVRPIWKPRYDKVLSNEQFIVTDEVETANGRQYIQVSFNPIVQDGRVIGGSCFGSDITVRKEAELEIQKQLDEKETLLREVHHRVKNNMATIESLLSLQASATTLPEVKAALQDTISRVQSSRVLYDKLLVSDNLNEVSVAPYANGLIDAIVVVFNLENNITIQRHISDFGITPKKAFFLGIIINELLTNVFKHAFQDHGGGGKVSVSIGREERTVTLRIQDNGVGFDDGSLANTSPGFGLSVVRMLVEQSGGTYTQSNENGARSVVRFELL